MPDSKSGVDNGVVLCTVFSGGDEWTPKLKYSPKMGELGTSGLICQGVIGEPGALTRGFCILGRRDSGEEGTEWWNGKDILDDAEITVRRAGEVRGLRVILSMAKVVLLIARCDEMVGGVSSTSNRRAIL